jgi:NCS1 family nucleobase:cation symporter-1
LWWSANLGMPPFLTGVLGPVLGLNVAESAAAVLLGNSIASLLLALTAAAGAGQGLGQMPLSRALFGRVGNYLPGGLNFLSTLGWYVVNTAIGGGALAALLDLNLGVAVALIALVQAAVAYLGHDVIHRLEHVLGYVQAALFLAVTAAIVGHWSHVSPAPGAAYGAFLLELAAVASYNFSWAPYASDYGRYLPADTSPRRVFWYVFLGSWLSCCWVELLGVLAAAMGLGSLSAVGIVQHLMGRFAAWAELAIVFGTLTANALNSYTCTLSLLTLDLRALRPYAAGAIAIVGGLVAFVSSAHFLADYENFLLLLSYWIGPWIAVTLVGHFARRRLTAARAVKPSAFEGPALWAFVAGLAVTVPFMSTTLFEGPLAARWLDHGDISYYLGFLAAAAVYGLLSRPRPASSARDPAPRRELGRPG